MRMRIYIYLYIYNIIAVVAGVTTIKAPERPSSNDPLNDLRQRLEEGLCGGREHLGHIDRGGAAR
jgi:hypothetical protein